MIFELWRDRARREMERQKDKRRAMEVMYVRPLPFMDTGLPGRLVRKVAFMQREPWWVECSQEDQALALRRSIIGAVSEALVHAGAFIEFRKDLEGVHACFEAVVLTRDEYNDLVRPARKDEQ